MSNRLASENEHNTATHDPVLLAEVLEFLGPKAGPGSIFIDATCGEGGHTRAFLERFPAVLVFGVDADKEQTAFAERRLKGFGRRIRFFTMRFSEFFAQYEHYNSRKPDAILFDLGISRFHYEKSGRGFSFSRDEYLDMRIDENGRETAFDIVNNTPQAELVRILREYGEEAYAFAIARAVCAARKTGPIRTSAALAALIRGAVPPAYRNRRLHAATKSFQALRIAVNGELAELEKGLALGFELLQAGGRIAVISFHSLEDRIVKRFFKEKNKSCICPPEWPICQCRGRKELVLLTKKPVTAGQEERTANPAARSAKLRVVEKCA
jgi:16S rRNA (cytosine1402-N4)-methyltransferase